MTDENMRPAPPPQPEQSPQRFFSALFDVRFTSYITPKIITVLYVLGMIAIVVAYLSYVVLAFNANAALGFVTLLIIGPLFALLALIWLRVTLEFYLALVRLSGDFRTWREEWRQRSGA
ncbi:MAG TPA: DUF4282 domain-containing protein [Jiangellaceae bacterium]